MFLSKYVLGKLKGEKNLCLQATFRPQIKAYSVGRNRQNCSGGRDEHRAVIVLRRHPWQRPFVCDSLEP
jgi:hypothetical protein